MKNSLAFAAIDFELGDLREIISNDQILPSIRVFASLSLSDGASILNYALEIKKTNDINEHCKNKIAILMAVIFLTLKKRDQCVKLLNELGPPEITKVAGWLEDYFFSTWNLLIKYLLLIPINYSNSEQNYSSYNVIGDSHIIGMMPALNNNNKYTFKYIPGLRYSLLASPQNNLKKIAIKNAMLFSYESDCIILSIGEIDTRAFLNGLELNIQSSKKTSLKYFENIFTKSINFLMTLIADHQELKIVIPPPPVLKNYKNFEESDLLNIKLKYLDVINLSKNIILNNNIKCITYPDSLTSGTGFVTNENMVDHAHFTEKIYMNLLGFRESQ